MNKLLVILLFMLACNAFCMSPVQVSDRLLRAISTVESGNRDNAVGDNGNAVGRYQLWKIYVDDANRISRKGYSYDDRYDPVKSKEMVIIVLTHYGNYYQRKTGKKCTDEILARIHNRGYNRWHDRLGELYWKKVKRYLK